MTPVKSFNRVWASSSVGWLPNVKWTSMLRVSGWSFHPLSTSKLSCVEKKTPDQTDNSPPELSERVHDEYNFEKLDNNEQKQKLSQFKQYMEKNSYYEKYKARIVATQKASPKSFLAMVENVIPAKKKESSHERLRASNIRRKSLSEIMKIDMLMELPRNDIIFIWKEYHRSIKGIGAAMTGQVYERTETNGKKYTTFVLPLPKEEGYEFYLVQYGAESFHFTQLIKYHIHKENSPVCLTLNFYKDLKNTKDLVLMRGEIDNETLGLEEAQFLAVQLNYYYSEGNQRRESLLKQFSDSSKEFDHSKVIEEVRALTMEHKDVFPKIVGLP